MWLSQGLRQSEVKMDDEARVAEAGLARMRARVQPPAGLSDAQVLTLQLVADRVPPKEILAKVRLLDREIGLRWVYRISSERERPKCYRGYVDALRQSEPMLHLNWRMTARRKVFEAALSEGKYAQALEVLRDTEKVLGAGGSRADR